MPRKHNKALTPNARKLRKNMTPEERKLWFEFLRLYPVHILRQKVIGNFIVDFYCAKAKLVIELDGSQHYSDAGINDDQKRTETLHTYDLAVIRFSNKDINDNFPGVCQSIDRVIQDRTMNKV
ncbi:endonuclease domain-containing protein [Sporomusa acidovorans]|uniref:DUF559 domain-containing protein n=1 Tax=Sporomusa acidovorans (strain ATCC 49682 / DSM 3132 / Mol) TaxID=1123286 RepID=A0ABZ3J9G8_SPOA4|nr:endonuclease domain-containing protein [Sporomusa acidovorans]OZC17380.1 hypothetical protein SPACI_38500 [Sporomusa acidovorans DSM 3132]SDF67271.1 Very-short-patch-repair endonuclease [Sporomusa acidovorans]